MFLKKFLSIFLLLSVVSLQCFSLEIKPEELTILENNLTVVENNLQKQKQISDNLTKQLTIAKNELTKAEQSLNKLSRESSNNLWIGILIGISSATVVAILVRNMV